MGQNDEDRMVHCWLASITLPPSFCHPSRLPTLYSSIGQAL